MTTPTGGRGPAMPAGRIVGVETLARFDALVEGGAHRMRGWRLQGVDLRGRTDVLLSLDPNGALVLGCDVTGTAAAHLHQGGAVVFPEIPEVPIDVYRPGTYTADELYANLAVGGYEATLDARVYAWSQRPSPRSVDTADTVARALHDAAMDDALDEAVTGRRVVGVMGGHAAGRDASGYREAAELARALARAGLLVATGGGPGAMEAANLGAHLAVHGDDVLDEAIDELAGVPTFRPSIDAWAQGGLDVLARWPDGDGGVGVPTWTYGHEPPNVFPSVIAKYFQNALREATLLRRCNGGIVFLPGAAGTVQEVFQDACENYYAEAPTVAPMVLVGIEHWTERVPAWPLLRALARDRAMDTEIALVESGAEAADLLIARC